MKKKDKTVKNFCKAVKKELPTVLKYVIINTDEPCESRKPS